KLTGITDAMVAGAPGISRAVGDFLDFAAGLPLVAHSASFDTGFIRHHARQCGIEFSNTIVDTLQLSRKLFPELNRHKLDIVAKHLGVSLKNHHRAVDDAQATAEIFIKCLEILVDKGAVTVGDIDRVLAGETDLRNLPAYHAILLVRDRTGLRNLYRIISESHLKYFYKKPRVPRSVLTRYRDGLLVGSACEAGELYRALLDGASDQEAEKIAGFYDYLEIQPLGNNEHLVESGNVQDHDMLKELNRRIVRLGEKLDKPVVATCDVHFMDPQDEVFRRILMHGQGYADAER